MVVVDMFRRAYISKTLTRIMILRERRRAHKFFVIAVVALCLRILLKRVLSSFFNAAWAKLQDAECKRKWSSLRRVTLM